GTGWDVDSDIEDLQDRDAEPLALPMQGRRGVRRTAVAVGRQSIQEERTMPPLLPVIDEADGVLDELQAWFLARAEVERWVYTSVLRQLVNRMYRDRDYLDRRKREGRHTAYDYAVDRDLKALAWAIRAIVRYTPTEEKAKPEPPKPPRKPSR